MVCLNDNVVRSLRQTPHTGYGGMTINYHYFANGWLRDVKKGNDLISEYEYDSSGNRTRVDFGNGTYQTFAYDTDPRYRMASIDYAYGCTGDEDIEVRGTLDLTRDNTGNPLTWGNDDYKKTYTYDDNNRLATAALPGNSTATYTYDWVGNRQGTGFTYNAADQMTASPNKTYNYDGNGNMLTGTMAFSYSPINLVTEAGGTSMAWDSMGDRVSFTTSGSATYQFVYDPSAGIPAVVEEVTPGGSVYYIREPSGALIARITGTGENQITTYYHFDELGSTLFLTDPDGILTDKYTYDAWGNVTSRVGDTQQPYQFVGQLGYYTHTQENGFKLLQLGVRLYDPGMGRFLQDDPERHGDNWYVYAGGQPTLYTDPTGLRPRLGKPRKRPPTYENCNQENVREVLTYLYTALGASECQRKIQRAGIAGCVRPMLQGRTIKCGVPDDDGSEGVCKGDKITLLDQFDAWTLLHEVVHACRNKRGISIIGKNPHDPSAGVWSCDQCERMPWGTEAEPYESIWEEKVAEGVVHACL